MKSPILSMSIILLAYCMVSCLSLNKGEEDPYNLCFNYSGTLTGFQWNINALAAKITLDIEKDIEGKPPLLLIQNHPYPTIPIKERLFFSAYQVLPVEQYNGEVKIVLNSKCQNVDSFWLKCASVDNYDNIIALDSVEVSHNTWQSDTLTLSCKGGKYLMIRLRALGDEPKPYEDQFVWLDRVELYSDDEKLSFGNIPSGKIPSKNVTTFHGGEIPQSFVPRNKKVIALGETVHGSQTLTDTQIELIKKMVEEGCCKLIIWEHYLPFTLYWDLYIQGSVPEERIELINQLVDLPSYVNFPDFLKWLRNYNLENYRKVKIIGNMNAGNDLFVRPLFYFVDAFYNDNTSATLFPLLKMINDGKDADVLEYTQANRQLLEDIMGDRYEEFLNVLSSCNNINSGIDWLDHRDYNMAKVCRDYIDTWLKEYESAVIVSHAEHVTKKYSPGLYYLKTMGNYLKSYYGDNYYSVLMTIGAGEIWSQELSTHETQKFVLDIPEKSSLEGIFMEKHEENLFVETYDLKKPIFRYRNIGNKVTSVKQVTIGNVQERFDAVIFINNGVIIDTEDREVDIYQLMLDRHMKIKKYAGDLKAIN